MGPEDISRTGAVALASLSISSHPYLGWGEAPLCYPIGIVSRVLALSGGCRKARPSRQKSWEGELDLREEGNSLCLELGLESSNLKLRVT